MQHKYRRHLIFGSLFFLSLIATVVLLSEFSSALSDPFCNSGDITEWDLFSKRSSHNLDEVIDKLIRFFRILIQKIINIYCAIIRALGFECR